MRRADCFQSALRKNRSGRRELAFHRTGQERSPLIIGEDEAGAVGDFRVTHYDIIVAEGYLHTRRVAAVCGPPEIGAFVPQRSAQGTSEHHVSLPEPTPYAPDTLAARAVHSSRIASRKARESAMLRAAPPIAGRDEPRPPSEVEVEPERESKTSR
jgi:hypothetical protein